MFFCNPWSDNEDNNGGPLKFPFLMDYEKFPWLRSGSETTPGLKSSNSSSTDDSSWEMEDDFPLDSSTSRIIFHDAVSLEDDKIFRSRKRRRRRSVTMVFWSCFLLLASFGISWMILGDSYKAITIDYWTSLLESFQDITIWSKSAALRLWDEVPTFALVTEQVTLFPVTLQKIDAAIWSLFQWDEVDDAIVEWARQTLVFAGKRILGITSETVSMISSSAVMEHFARSILQTVIDAPGSKQALAILDFLQDAEP